MVRQVGSYLVGLLTVIHDNFTQSLEPLSTRVLIELAMLGNVQSCVGVQVIFVSAQFALRFVNVYPSGYMFTPSGVVFVC